MKSKAKIQNNKSFSLGLLLQKSKKHVAVILTLGILLLLIPLRFYQINERSPFGWDQVDNAWAAGRIIVNHALPLLGMQAKGNSGVFIGPLYYYLIAIVYFVTNLDPIASGIFAGLTSVFSFCVIYYVGKKMFSTEVALIASFINTVAVFGIVFDRVQWPINFIPPISLLIFYFLYKIVTGKNKYIIFLAIAIGFSFHVHFTSLFFPIIILFVLPFFPFSKKTFAYMGIGSLVVLLFLIPTILGYLNNSQSISHASGYGQSYYHGFHLRRVSQLVSDAFIQFEFYLRYPQLKILKYIFIPLFIVTYVWKKEKREHLLMSYLVVLFFLIPWLALSTYSGELTDYYFAITRFVALLLISYCIALVYAYRSLYAKIIVICLLGIYGFYNISDYLRENTDNGMILKRETVLQKINRGERVGFFEGSAESYLYFYYMKKDKGKIVY
jgi:4-amino-4-deoxy-L-arabinose transferase-like glycosyltransferase